MSNHPFKLDSLKTRSEQQAQIASCSMTSCPTSILLRLSVLQAFHFTDISLMFIKTQVELEVTGERLEKYEAPDAELESCRTPEAQSLPSAEEDGKESQQEDRGQRADPGTGDRPASPRESPEPRVDPQTRADESEQPGHGEPAVDGEIQVAAGSGEAAEEIARPDGPEPGQTPPSEDPVRELEAADVKQEHTG